MSAGNDQVLFLVPGDDYKQGLLIFPPFLKSILVHVVMFDLLVDDMSNSSFCWSCKISMYNRLIEVVRTVRIGENCANLLFK